VKKEGTKKSDRGKNDAKKGWVVGGQEKKESATGKNQKWCRKPREFRDGKKRSTIKKKNLSTEGRTTQGGSKINIRRGKGEKKKCITKRKQKGWWETPREKKEQRAGDWPCKPGSWEPREGENRAVEGTPQGFRNGLPKNQKRKPAEKWGRGDR